MAKRISFIIPVLNEEKILHQSLSALQPLRSEGHEIIVVDGGSEDSSRTLSESLSDRVILGPQGRSRQMNAGSRVARGEVLLFLHADTLLPRDAGLLIISRMEQEKKDWGRFDVRLSGRHPLFRVIECLMNWRSRLSGIATGDQGIFVKGEVFQSVGGYPEIDLMEDIALSRILKRHGPPVCLSEKIVASSRRWERNGILQTVLLMWRLRLAYFLGTDPQALARLYRKSKSS
jgi:rSAM/selenodomain-associated transferase 2